MNSMHNLYSFAFPGDPFAFFEAPEAEGDGQPSAEIDDGNAAGTDAGSAAAASGTAGKTFTQADVDRIVAERAKRAEESAVRSLLSKNKFDKPEDLETFLAEARKKADSELSEVERMKKMLDEAPKAEAVTELQAQLEEQNKVITGLVEGLVKDLNVPKHIVTLLEGMPPTQQLEYINKNRDAFKPTPAPPNLNGGDKGGTNKSDAKKKRRESVKSRIPALNKRR